MTGSQTPTSTQRNSHPVRPARAADKDQIIDMLAAVQRLERGLVGDPVLPADQVAEKYYKQVQKNVQKRDGLELIYEMDGVIVGYLTGYPETDKDVLVAKDFHQHALITDIYVNPTMRNLGVARGLMDAFEKAMQERGIEYVRLWSKAKNTGAHAAWNKMGFEPYETVFVKKLSHETE